MLKKILPIFFILCLVFSLTVPVFAQDIGRPVYYNQLFDPSLRFSPVTSQNGSSVVYTGDSFVLTIPNVGAYQGVQCYPNIDPSTNDIFFCIIIGDLSSTAPLQIDYLNGTGAFFISYSSSVWYCKVSRSAAQVACFLKKAINSGFDDVYTINRLYFVNLSEIYSDPSSVTFANFITDFPMFAEDSVSYTQSSFYNPDISSGFSKMLSFTHVFDRIPYFFDQYTTVTVWIVGSVSLSIVIFVIVFMIKRFSGGRS